MNFELLQELGYTLIPIEANGKRPLTKNGVKDGTNDLDTITSWAAQYPGCNWGIVCDNLIVFDLDKKVGRNELPEQEMLSHWTYLSEKYDLPVSPIVVTGSGGRHYYFRKPDVPIKGSVKLTYYRDGTSVKSNIDIRVGNQYVVAPGSIHESGNSYECDCLLSVDELSELPQSFIDILPKPGDRQPRSQVRGEFLDSDFIVERCKKWVDKADIAVQGQDGSSQMLRVANAIFWGFGLSKHVGWNILVDYNLRCDPPFSDSELEHKYDETQSKPQDKTFGYLAQDNSTDIYGKVSNSLIDKTRNEVIRQPTSRGRLVMTRGTDIELKPERWLWEDRILMGALTVIFGIGAVGKSALVLDWVARITSGKCWPDGTPCSPGSVLYFSSEETPDNAKAKVQFWGGDLSNFYYVNGCETANGKHEVFDMTKDGFLEETLEEFKTDSTRLPVKLIVLDPVASVLGDANENSNKEVRNMLERLSPILSRHNVSCIGIAHSRKPSIDEKVLSRHRLAGSIAFANLPRTVWEIVKEDSGQSFMLISKSNLTETPKGLSYHFDEAIKRPELMGRKLSNLVYDDSSIDYTMDDYISTKAEDRPVRTTNREKAAGWLKDFLSFGEKPVGNEEEYGTILFEAKIMGFSKNTIYRVKQDGLVDIETFKTNNITYWKLPDPTESSVFGLELTTTGLD